MSDILLTNDADFLLCTLYDAYRQRRRNGASIRDARLFGGSETIQQEFAPTWPTDDIDEAAWALARKGLVETSDADDTIWAVILCDDGIAYMEQRFGDKLDKLLDRIAKLRSIIIPLP